MFRLLPLLFLTVPTASAELVTSIRPASTSPPPPSPLNSLRGSAQLHPQCQPLQTYQADYVQATYARDQHMGFYYELAFRDL
jgi:hypothetical protein